MACSLPLDGDRADRKGEPRVSGTGARIRDRLRCRMRPWAEKPRNGAVRTIREELGLRIGAASRLRCCGVGQLAERALAETKFPVARSHVRSFLNVASIGGIANRVRQEYDSTPTQK